MPRVPRVVVVAAPAALACYWKYWKQVVRPKGGCLILWIIVRAGGPAYYCYIRGNRVSQNAFNALWSARRLRLLRTHPAAPTALSPDLRCVCHFTTACQVVGLPL